MTFENKHFEPLTDSQWQQIEFLFPKPVKRGRGKPHTPWRKVVNSVLYVHVQCAKWAALPKGPEWSSKSAAHRWYLIWKQNGLLEQILKNVSSMKIVEGPLDLTFRQEPLRLVVSEIAPSSLERAIN